MNMLMKWLEDAKKINDEEKGVSYGEEAFNQIYEEAVALVRKHNRDISTATGKGILIGAASTGLVVLGINKINKTRKRKSKEVKVSVEDLEKLVDSSIKLELLKIDDTDTVIN
jgi:hypothetical protein